MVKVTEIKSFLDYGKAVEISNGVISTIVSVQIGPRIVRYGYVDSQNFIHCNRAGFPDHKNDKTYTDFFGEGRHWETMGGHRIWLAPETYPETYTPDDKPCEYTVTEHGAIFTYAEDTEVGAAKQLEIKMDPDDTNMQVIMRIKNISNDVKRFAVWGISVCNRGGTLVVPFNDNDTGLIPNRKVALWPYTDMSSDIFHWGKNYFTIKQKHTGEEYTAKIGFDSNCGTVYYVLNDEILCKRFETFHPNAEYPDCGSSLESYICNEMIEIESLGPLKDIAPNETNEHIELWSLCKSPFSADLTDDNEIDKLLSSI